MEKEKYEFYENSIYHRIGKYLFDKYDLRLNRLSLDYEISEKGKDKWRIVNLSDLIIELCNHGIKADSNKVGVFISSNLIESYNPIQDYFKNLKPWDGKDHIRKLASYVKTKEPELFLYHLEKWLVRAVLCVMIDGFVAKQALILYSKNQNSGKTTWCRYLLPSSLVGLMSEDLNTDKDSRIKLCTNFLINLDDLDTMSRKAQGVVKSYFSRAFINDRLPYAKKSTHLPRNASFLGSTNQLELLTDESGSVRWLIFELDGPINFKYSKEVNIDDVWAQAYHLSKDNSFNAELTREDISINEERNTRFSFVSFEYEIILKYFEKSDNPNEWLNASEVVECLPNLPLNKITVGRALNRAKFERVKIKTLYKYKIKKKQGL